MSTSNAAAVELYYRANCTQNRTDISSVQTQPRCTWEATSRSDPLACTPRSDQNRQLERNCKESSLDSVRCTHIPVRTYTHSCIFRRATCAGDCVTRYRVTQYGAPPISMRGIATLCVCVRASVHVTFISDPGPSYSHVAAWAIRSRFSARCGAHDYVLCLQAHVQAHVHARAPVAWRGNRANFMVYTHGMHVLCEP